MAELIRTKLTTLKLQCTYSKECNVDFCFSQKEIESCRFVINCPDYILALSILAEEYTTAYLLTHDVLLRKSTKK